MEHSTITRCRGRPRKTIGEIVKKDLNINDLNTICSMIEHYGVV